MKNELKIALLGVEDSLYTRMMLAELRRAGVAPDLVILERRRAKHVSKLHSVLQRAAGLAKMVASGPFWALPAFHWFYWWKLVRRIAYRRSATFREAVEEYASPKMEELVGGAQLVPVPFINHVDVYQAIRETNIDIGVLGGVGIVAGPIVTSFNTFCLNAHPAPLPECRGGGALEQTLYKRLQPAASVHVATPEVDEGDVLAVKHVPVAADDSFESVYFKLQRAACEAMASTVRKVLDGEPLQRIPNDGQLNYWRDCTLSIQRQAERELRRLKSRAVQ